MKILLVDDAQFLLMRTKKMLVEKRHTVETANGGKQAIEMLENNTYDVVLLDVNMPDVSGLDVLDSIKQKKIKAKVIMLTSESAKETIMKSIEKGAAGYMMKPFEVDKLIAKIEKVVGS